MENRVILPGDNSSSKVVFDPGTACSPSRKNTRPTVVEDGCIAAIVSGEIWWEDGEIRIVRLI